MDKVFINDLLVRAIIGINDWERKNKQDILINITLFAELQKAGETDDINDAPNYRTAAKKIIEYVESSKRFTVEALANDVATLCLEDRNVKKVIVRLEKPGAVRFSKSVGVEIERSNS
ncbi:MAG: dihydroneopterin aldolase [Chloroflexi bacterium]|nr:dihydroneopterin aldolase [Chloroflexota bacterium]